MFNFQVTIFILDSKDFFISKDISTCIKTELNVLLNSKIEVIFTPNIWQVFQYHVTIYVGQNLSFKKAY